MNINKYTIYIPLILNIVCRTCNSEKDLIVGQKSYLEALAFENRLVKSSYLLVAKRKKINMQ